MEIQQLRDALLVPEQSMISRVYELSMCTNYPYVRTIHVYELSMCTNMMENNQLLEGSKPVAMNPTLICSLQEMLTMQQNGASISSIGLPKRAIPSGSSHSAFQDSSTLAAWEIPVSELVLGPSLGQGRGGEVRQARYHGMAVAVKIVYAVVRAP